MTKTITRPKPFDGTDEERAANRRTHYWIVTEPGEARVCSRGDYKEWHAAAEWPCGAFVPREEIELTGDPETDAKLTFPGLFGRV